MQSMRKTQKVLLAVMWEGKLVEATKLLSTGHAVFTNKCFTLRDVGLTIKCDR